MDDAFRVRERECLPARHADRHDLGERHRTFGDALIERLSAEQLHHEERALVLGHTEVGDVDDVLVIELRGRVRLEVEACTRFEVLGELDGEHLRGKALLQRLVLDQIHDSHSAKSDRLDDAVVLTEHRVDERIYTFTHHERDTP